MLKTFVYQAMSRFKPKRKLIFYFLYMSSCISVFMFLSFIFGHNRFRSSLVRINNGHLIGQTPDKSGIQLSMSGQGRRYISKEFPTVNFNFHNFSCNKLFSGVSTEMEKAKAFLISNKYTFKHQYDDGYSWRVTDCDRFKRSRGFIVTSPTEAESDFPLAFNILFHRNVEQLERLLRVLFRPQNQYCIHVDRKTPHYILKAVTNIANCFENVFIASKLEIVVYASNTRLLADINCMEDHIKKSRDWKYLLNLAASELPLRTNLEIVEILKIFNGSNDIHEVFSGLDKSRFERKHITYIDLKNKTGHIIHTNQIKEKPPGGLTITKGNAYNVFSRAFVEFALTNKLAKELLNWSAETLTPDEHYWATLNNLHNNGFLKTPGGFSGNDNIYLKISCQI